MPAPALAAVALAPKAGAAAVAAAGGADVLSDAAHHVSQHVHNVSFLQLPIAKQKLFKMIFGPEIAAYHWIHNKLDNLHERVFGQPVAGPDQARMVEYFAAGCPHCKHLEPVWKDAVSKWAQQDGTEANKVVWQTKQCLDEHWKPGRDYQECKDQHIYGFPTVRFFGPGAEHGDDFFLERTPDKLVEFAKTGVHPDPLNMPRLEGDVSDVKMVDFYSAACPHCKALDPVWEKATQKWEETVKQAEEAPLAVWQKKECFDKDWNPGKDSAECEKFHVDAFPTIRLFKPDPHGHGFAGVDYDGARSPEALNDFLKKEVGMPDVPAPAAHAAAAEPSPAADAADAAKEAPAAAAADHGAVGTPQEEERAEVPVAAAIKAAMVPLPMLTLSCLPPARKRKELRSAESPPASVSAFM